MKIKILKKNNIFVSIIILGFISLIPVFSKYQDLALKNRHLKIRMKEISSENKILRDKQYKLQNDPIYAESVARQKLNVAKEGEVIYKVLPEGE